jgi:plasmid stabilization system protein ParE
VILSENLFLRLAAMCCDESLREVVYENYRVVYRVRPDAVEILTVFHGARLLRLE